MDFVSDSLANGRRVKFLTVADDFSHECVDITADWGISGLYVTRLLDRVAIFRSYPLAVRTDNGPEFTSTAFMAWTSHADRLHRELQRKVQGRAPERTMVPDAATGQLGISSLRLV